MGAAEDEGVNKIQFEELMLVLWTILGLAAHHWAYWWVAVPAFFNAAVFFALFCVFSWRERVGERNA